MTLSRKAPLKPGTGFLRSHTRMKSASLDRIATKEAAGAAKVRMKSRGLKGRPPTADEQRFMDAMGALGCRACAKDGIENAHISLHHIDGRTKPGAHFLVISLCGPHHQQDDTDPMGRISVHGYKARFEAKYGTQYELLAEAKARLEQQSGAASCSTLDAAPDHNKTY
ncbi:MAG: Ref family recombination enhancement nuclease [Telluria sp.]